MGTDGGDWIYEGEMSLQCTNIDGDDGIGGRRMRYRRSIVKMHPKIAAQWHPTRNGNRTPDEFTAGSNYRAWWKCPVAKDHQWQATIKSRRIRGCPCCSGKTVVRSNCFATTHPKLAAQWHPTKNGNRTPAEFTAGSNYRAWWKCPVAKDHEWQATITSRRLRGCPCCAGKEVVKSNCVATTHPKLAAQWHPTKNERGPDRFTAGSKYKAWWQCPVVKDHEWQATIGHRQRGRNCPYCYNERRWGDGGSTWTGYGEISGTYWASIKSHARQRDDRKFNITIQYAWNLFIEQGRMCSLTGQLLTMLDHKGKTASLARLSHF